MMRDKSFFLLTLFKSAIRPTLEKHSLSKINKSNLKKEAIVEILLNLLMN